MISYITTWIQVKSKEEDVSFAVSTLFCKALWLFRFGHWWCQDFRVWGSFGTFVVALPQNEFFFFWRYSCKLKYHICVRIRLTCCGQSKKGLGHRNNKLPSIHAKKKTIAIMSLGTNRSISPNRKHRFPKDMAWKWVTNSLLQTGSSKERTSTASLTLATSLNP